MLIWLCNIKCIILVHCNTYSLSIIIYYTFKFMFILINSWKFRVKIIFFFFLLDYYKLCCRLLWWEQWWKVMRIQICSAWCGQVILLTNWCQGHGSSKVTTDNHFVPVFDGTACLSSVLKKLNQDQLASES